MDFAAGYIAKALFRCGATVFHDKFEGFMEIETEKGRLISNREFVQVKETDMLIQEMENLNLEARGAQGNEFQKLVIEITILNMKCEFDPFSIQIPSLEQFS
ncbi:unnamed protein product [Lathyrus oleraceus]|uniref:Uncharacterized protein n=1 Tax=Pisum sativum TaxID=3888 RepID=A0A9D4YAE5_PEA|nr:uncharacterized protein LOC127117699 [Pisum sativum]KAI5433036.1 hypothetical protein KIW84_020362 [Pisum sativum]